MKISNVQKWFLIAAISIGALTVSARASADTDNKIESSAKDSHVFKTYLKDDSITVKSKDGIVLLTGNVANSSHKSLAKSTVESLPGVTKVNNQLIVKGQGGEQNQDGWISTKIKTTLMFHRNVNAGSTQVDVKDGNVTLQGKADSSAEKDLTGEYAKDIDGVKSVDNKMTVVSESSEKPKTSTSGKIDDASITAQVKMALLYHSSTSAIQTKVKTNDGVVMVSGKAKNSAEKDLVTKLVMNINGVNNVDNKMTVGSKS